MPAGTTDVTLKLQSLGTRHQSQYQTNSEKGTSHINLQLD